jgi:hypothetical protein
MLVAVLSLASIAEGAAPKKPLRHRTRHSSRVLAGSSTTHKKKPVRRTHKTTPTTARSTTGTAGSSGSGSKSTTSKGATRAVKRAPSTPSTKPR